jgi:hypothetical protein
MYAGALQNNVYIDIFYKWPIAFQRGRRATYRFAAFILEYR